MPTKSQKGKKKNEKKSQRARVRECSKNETIIALARKEKNEKMDDKERARARARERLSLAGIFFFKILFSSRIILKKYARTSLITHHVQPDPELVLHHRPARLFRDLYLLRARRHSSF